MRRRGGGRGRGYERQGLSTRRTLLAADLLPLELSFFPGPQAAGEGVAITLYGRDFPALGRSLTSGERS